MSLINKNKYCLNDCTRRLTPASTSAFPRDTRIKILELAKTSDKIIDVNFGNGKPRKKFNGVSANSVGNSGNSGNSNDIKTLDDLWEKLKEMPYNNTVDVNYRYITHYYKPEELQEIVHKINEFNLIGILGQVAPNDIGPSKKNNLFYHIIFSGEVCYQTVMETPYLMTFIVDGEYLKLYDLIHRIVD